MAMFIINFLPACLKHGRMVWGITTILYFCSRATWNQCPSCFYVISILDVDADKFVLYIQSDTLHYQIVQHNINNIVSGILNSANLILFYVLLYGSNIPD